MKASLIRIGRVRRAFSLFLQMHCTLRQLLHSSCLVHQSKPAPPGEVGKFSTTSHQGRVGLVDQAHSVDWLSAGRRQMHNIPALPVLFFGAVSAQGTCCVISRTPMLSDLCLPDIALIWLMPVGSSPAPNHQQWMDYVPKTVQKPAMME